MAVVWNRAYAGALLAATLLVSSPAFAQLLTFDYTFSYVAGTNYGTLTGSFGAATTGSAGVYDIKTMTGTLGGAPITSLLGVNTFLGNDNVLNYPGAPAYVNVAGVAFTVGGTSYNLYYYGLGGGGNPYGIANTQATSVYSGTVTPRGAPGPCRRSRHFLLSVALSRGRGDPSADLREFREAHAAPRLPDLDAIRIACAPRLGRSGATTGASIVSSAT